jgi:threonyl-tRNA synthetase
MLELSTRPMDSMGSDDGWELATKRPEDGRLLIQGLALQDQRGRRRVYYGRKIDFHLQDCIGRTLQWRHHPA